MLALTALALLLTGFLTFSSFEAHFTADAVLPAFISLFKWTPFFWGENRYGMLVALLATPFRAPLLNFEVQVLLQIFLGLLAIMLIVRWLCDEATQFVCGTLLSWALLVSCFRSWHVYNALVVQSYGTSLFLAFAALLLHERSELRPAARAAATIACFALAFWVNVAVGTLLLALFSAKLVQGSRDRAGWLCVLAAFVPNLALLFYLPGPSCRLGFPERWRPGLARLLTELLTLVFPSRLGVVAAAGSLLLVAASRKGGLKSGFLKRQGAIVGMACLAFAVFLAIDRHVQENNYSARYLIPCFYLAVSLGGAVLALPLARVRAARPALVLTLVVFGLTVFDFGAPEPDAFQKYAFEKWRSQADELIASGSGALFGDYWKVWPLAFVALSRVTRLEPRNAPLLPLSDRAWSMREVWRPSLKAGLRLAALKGDESTVAVSRLLNLPPFEAESASGSFQFFRIRRQE